MGLLLSLTGPALSQDTYQLPDGATVSTLDTFRECDVCPEMVVLPLGSFVMGAPLEESAFLHFITYRRKSGVQLGFAREGPEHEVEIDIPIAIGRNEVTFSEWMACVDAGGCRHTPDTTVAIFTQTLQTTVQANHPRHPVAAVNFDDIAEYASWLNTQVGAPVYRLPTEAEWEYAARAGTTTRFAQGDDLDNTQANVIILPGDMDNYVPFPNPLPFPVMPIPVDELQADNPWGVRHMSGNVAEWTWTCRSERHLGLARSSEYLNIVLRSPPCAQYTSKGGHFSAVQELARLAYRGTPPAKARLGILGFRLVREMKGN